MDIEFCQVLFLVSVELIIWLLILHAVNVILSLWLISECWTILVSLWFFSWFVVWSHNKPKGIVLLSLPTAVPTFIFQVLLESFRFTNEKHPEWSLAWWDQQIRSSSLEQNKSRIQSQGWGLPWWSRVKTLHFHCKGHRFNTRSGKFHMPPWYGKKKKKKKKKKTTHTVPRVSGMQRGWHQTITSF